jgi:3-hydroxymyristoyl/3-hydroxydecanoyl-(acyl carrier protein) dehydratase
MAANMDTKLFHRFPFVLVDRPEERRPGASASLRLLSIDDALHEGLAGTTYAQSLLIEAMAQAAALFAEEGERRESGMLVGLREVTFGRPPRAGDRLEVSAQFVQRFGNLVRVAGRVTASGETLAEGEILLSVADARGE